VDASPWQGQSRFYASLGLLMVYIVSFVCFLLKERVPASLRKHVLSRLWRFLYKVAFIPVTRFVFFGFGCTDLVVSIDAGWPGFNSSSGVAENTTRGPGEWRAPNLRSLVLHPEVLATAGSTSAVNLNPGIANRNRATYS
jgi:hypothetical protein